MPSNPNELVKLEDMICPVCHEHGSVFLVADPRYYLRRFETYKGPVFVHLKCIDDIVREWIETKMGRTL